MQTNAITPETVFYALFHGEQTTVARSGRDLLVTVTVNGVAWSLEGVARAEN